MNIQRKHFKKFFKRYCLHVEEEKLWHKWRDMMTFIMTVKRQPEFFAQCCYESNYFRRTEENLNYTTPERIMKIFKRVKTLKQAKTLVRNPKKLAEVAYLNHPDLGNNSKEAKALYKKRPFSVWDFRGKGFIQVTGFNNWKKFQTDTKIDLFGRYPIENAKNYFIESPWLASAWWWIDHDIDYCADMREMTKIINGGTNGLKKRIQIFKDMLQIMKENP